MVFFIYRILEKSIKLLETLSIVPDKRTFALLTTFNKCKAGNWV